MSPPRTILKIGQTRAFADLHGKEEEAQARMSLTPRAMLEIALCCNRRHYTWVYAPVHDGQKKTRKSGSVRLLAASEFAHIAPEQRLQPDVVVEKNCSTFSQTRRETLKLSNILAELKIEKQAIEKTIAALEVLGGDKREPGRRPRRRPHWTQRPENRAKVRRIMRAALRIRKAKTRQ
jgi:hypothetical protein